MEEGLEVVLHILRINTTFPGPPGRDSYGEFKHVTPKGQDSENSPELVVYRVLSCSDSVIDDEFKMI